MLKYSSIVISIIICLVLSGCANTNVAVMDDNVTVSNSVNIDDNTKESFSFFLTQTTQLSNLTNDITVGDKIIEIDNTTNCEIFDAIDIYDNNYYFQTLIENKTSTTITLRNEIDKNFSVNNTTIRCGEWDLSTSDGSINPETFMISPPNNRTWHIKTTVFNCLDDKEMDSSKFCGDPSLDNGISGRIIDGYRRDLFLIYNNNGFKLRGFDLDYIEKAPAGVYGLNAKLNFLNTFGSLIEIKGNTNDEWQAVNRDDLTTQEEIVITINGNIVK